MGKLTAWIVSFENGTEQIYLLDSRKFNSEAQVLDWLGRIYGLPVLAATNQVAARSAEVVDGVAQMCTALNNE